MKKRAFTLIELLVVISVIAVLMSILMPALQIARKQAATGRCLSNTKNLSLGWYMYMQENNGLIMSSEDNGKDRNEKYVGWCGIPRDEHGTLLSNSQQNPPVTDEDEIRGIKVGMLYPYVNNPDAYHCPAATIKSMYDQTRIFVNYSIPKCLNGSPQQDDSRQIKCYDKISSPSTRYVFVEAAETRNWNQSHHFVMGAPEYTNRREWGWWGPIAINHGDSSVLGFCDGHSEVRKWRDPFTIARVNRLIGPPPSDVYGIDYPPADQQSDIEYMAAGWAYRHPMLNRR
jgi:prepilin-type N-terminal cleavage/methylation domain-containing protein